jgi:hypothetical protein
MTFGLKSPTPNRLLTSGAPSLQRKRALHVVALTCTAALLLACGPDGNLGDNSDEGPVDLRRGTGGAASGGSSAAGGGTASIGGAYSPAGGSPNAGAPSVECDFVAPQQTYTCAGWTYESELGSAADLRVASESCATDYGSGGFYGTGGGSYGGEGGYYYGVGGMAYGGLPSAGGSSQGYGAEYGQPEPLADEIPGVGGATTVGVGGSDSGGADAGGAGYGAYPEGAGGAYIATGGAGSYGGDSSAGGNPGYGAYPSIGGQPTSGGAGYGGYPGSGGVSAGGGSTGPDPASAWCESEPQGTKIGGVSFAVGTCQDVDVRLPLLLEEPYSGQYEVRVYGGYDKCDRGNLITTLAGIGTGQVLEVPFRTEGYSFISIEMKSEGYYDFAVRLRDRPVVVPTPLPSE